MSGIIDQFNLPIKKTFVPSSNGKSLVPHPDEDDVIIQQDVLTDTYDFFGFPNAAVNPANGDISVVFTEAQGHGQPALGNRISFSRDGGQTWEASKPMATPGLGKIGHLWHGNKIIFYHFNTSDYSQWLRTSDDEGDSFSEFEEIYSLYPPPGQLWGPGDPIRYGPYFLKPLYGRPTASGPRHVLLISNNNGGEGAYSLHSIPVRLTHAASLDGNPEEPGICALPNGVILCYFRTGDVESPGVMVTRSIDGGFTWDEPRFAFPSWGRPGCGVSPSGTVCILGREQEAEGRAIFAYSNDMGETHVWDYLDSRVNNLQTYGVPVWHLGTNRFVAIYASDTNYPNGPCFTLAKFIDEI